MSLLFKIEFDKDGFVKANLRIINPSIKKLPGFILLPHPRSFVTKYEIKKIINNKLKGRFFANIWKFLNLQKIAPSKNMYSHGMKELFINFIKTVSLTLK